MSKLLMIILLGGFISYGILSIPQNNLVTQSTVTSVLMFSKDRSRNIANSMAEMLLSKVSDDNTWRANTWTDNKMFDGTARYKVIDTALAPNDTIIKFSVSGSYDNYTTNIEVYASTQSGFVPPIIRGVWTANGPLNKTISDMYIDGRDHNISGNIIPYTGVYGISTSISFVNTENASIGGTKDSIDYPMSYPANPNVIEQNYDWGGHFPTNPDEALGLPDGTLKSIAMSGKGGSQFVTSTSKLSFPLTGITYIDLPAGKEEKIDLTKGGINKGILIIHNASGTARINQTATASGSWFEGIIIGDYMFHFHCDVHGAIILLSPNLETSHECNGNKDHKVQYSTQAVEKATTILGINKYTKNKHGLDSHRISVRYWYE